MLQVLPQHPQQQQQHYGGLPDEDSLVLYKDTSGLSMQQSVASVASGAQCSTAKQLARRLPD
jgi:hypothetical protein